MTPDELAALHARCFVNPRPWSAAEFAALASAAGTFLLTRPHGFLLGRAAGGEAELLTLAVDPSARRQGTGRKLVGMFLRRAAEAGAGEAFLEVNAANLAALTLYAETGWSRVGLRRGYYAGEDAVVMRHPLDSAPPGT